MGTVRIENVLSKTATTVVEVYEAGSMGQAPTLVATHLLGAAMPVAELGIGPTRYLVVREPTESEAKTIDNWSQTPTPGNEG